MTKKNFINSSFVALSLLAFGCAKERPEEFSQGQGRDILSISAYNGQTFELTTTSLRESESVASSATRDLVINDYEGINNMMVVDYVTDAPLFQGFTFRGLPNHKYTIQYEVTNEYLVVNKISEKDAIPFDELTYATQLKDGRYKVPLVGYPIRLVSVENAKNSYGEDSRKLIEMSEKNIANASHFEISSVSSYKLFAAQQKIDVFPADFFEGQWFYAATIVSASTKNATSIGRDLSVDAEADSVSRIEFKKYKDSVLAYNLNLDQIISRDDDINLKKAFKLPVSWVDYKREEINGQVSLSEVALDNENKESPSWESRRFMKIDFKSVSSIITDGINDGVLQKLEVAKDYISWTIWYPSSEIRVKFALRRAHKPIAGRVYRKSDFNNFGFFKTYKHYIKNHRQYRDEDYEKLVLLNRFNPENKVIEYYFSSNTSKEMREVGRKGIAAWNDAFDAAGTGIKVVLNESRDVELGDLRYNILNIVDTKDGSGLLGYGPSISDSESGEIISATTNIYANPFREGLISNVRNYIKKELGKYSVVEKELNLQAKSSNRLNSAIGLTSATAGLGSISDSMANSTEFKVFMKNFSAMNENAEELGFDAKKLSSAKNDIYKLLNIKDKAKTESHNALEHLMHHGSDCSYSVVDNNSYERIAEKCEEVNDYVKELASMPGQPTHDSREVEVIEKCANKLLEENVLSTVVHELGHNFGLRHNFAGSNDPENFSKDKLGRVKSMTSSVMDYLASDVAELIEPGKYDVAAIKFGYAEKVETNDGKDLSVSKRSIEEALSASGEEVKSYKFCTDEHVSLTDPLCTRWDQGSNPEEVVDHIIADFKSFVAIYGRKYDRAFSPSEVILGNKMFNALFSLKAIHDQWRYYLAQEVGDSAKYLQNLNEKSFSALIEQLNNSDSDVAKGHQRYYVAATKAYEFLKELAFHASKVCQIENKDGELTSLDFEQARQRVWSLQGKDVYSCSDIARATGSKLISEGGYFLNDIKVSNNPGNKDDYLRNQIAGLETARRIAMLALVIRTPVIDAHYYENFFPNFMDNPVWRSEIGNLIHERATQGVTSKSLSENSAKTLGDDSILKLFTTEKNIIVNLYTSYASSFSVPGDTEATMERNQTLATIYTRDARVIPQGYLITDLGGAYIGAHPSSKSGELVKLRNELDHARTISKSLISKELLEELKKELNDKYNTLFIGDFFTKESLEATGKKLGGDVSEIISYASDSEDSVKTVGEVVTSLGQNLQKAQMTIQFLVPKVGQGIVEYLVTAFKVESKVLSVLSAKLKAKPELKDKKVTELLVELFEAGELNIQDIILLEISKGAVVEEYHNLGSEYLENMKENDSQLDVITKILINL